MFGFSIYFVIFRPDLTSASGPYPNARDSIIALSSLALVFATALLAFATFVLAGENNEQEKKHRIVEIQKDERDRKERWLNETIEWLKEVDTSATVSILTEMLYSPDFSKTIQKLSLMFPRELSNFEYFKRLMKSISSSLSTHIETSESAYKTLTKAFSNIQAKEKEALTSLAKVSLSKHKEGNDLTKEDVKDALDKIIGSELVDFLEKIDPVHVTINNAIILAVEEKRDCLVIRVPY